MSDTLPQFYRKVDDPHNDLYELVMLTGFELDGKRHVLYVCKNCDGGLSEAFRWEDIGKTWTIDFEAKRRKGKDNG